MGRAAVSLSSYSWASPNECMTAFCVCNLRFTLMLRTYKTIKLFEQTLGTVSAVFNTVQREIRCRDRFTCLARRQPVSPANRLLMRPDCVGQRQKTAFWTLNCIITELLQAVKVLTNSKPNMQSVWCTLGTPHLDRRIRRLVPLQFVAHAAHFH